MDWNSELATATSILRGIHALDKAHLWPHHLPRSGAAETAILRVEEHLGYRLDKHLRTFLGFADGWPAFFQSVDLFGTDELLGGPSMRYAVEMLGVLPDDVFESSQVSREDLLPIAATLHDRDIFVITRAEETERGAVIWLAGYEIERFHNFDEFFVAMMNYNREELADLRREKSNATVNRSTPPN